MASRVNYFLLACSLCAASVAVAQEAPLPSLPPLAEVPPAIAEPAATSAPPVLNARERRDGTVGVGYLGLSAITPSTGGLGGLGGLGIFRVQVPLLGVRWWLRGSRLGLDFGVGAMVATSPDAFAPALQVVAHAGLPIAVASTQHVIVFLAPEFRAGFSALTGGASINASLLELALRAGVELFFGFIGVPELSVEASIRVGVAREVQSFANFSPFGGGSAFNENFRFSTSLSGDAATVIASSLSLRYYF